MGGIISQIAVGIVPVLVGAFVAYIFAIRQFSKQRTEEKKANLRWKACQEAWIPLAETITSILEKLRLDSDYNILSHGWNGRCFRNDKKIEDTFDECFSYLRPSKRGLIGGMLSEIEELKGYLEEYNISLDQKTEKLTHYVEEEIKKIRAEGVLFEVNNIDIRYKKNLSDHIRKELMDPYNRDNYIFLETFIDGIWLLGEDVTRFCELPFLSEASEALERISEGFAETTQEYSSEIEFSMAALTRFRENIQPVQKCINNKIVNYKFTGFGVTEVKRYVEMRLTKVVTKINKLIDNEYASVIMYSTRLK